MKYSFFIFCFLALHSGAQIVFSQRQVDLGRINEANEIKGSIIVTNPGDRKVFLMRADADNGVKVHTSKKTLLPGDTALLVISFQPASAGPFRQNIRLVSSDQETPHKLTVSGNLDKLAADNKTACYYFGSRSAPVAVRSQSPMVIPPDTPAHRDARNRMPDHVSSSVSPVTKGAPEKTETKISTDTKTVSPQALPEHQYKPNNILFLVDVSGSMKDSLKLPLMKLSLHKLIDAVRGIDSITLVTYADTVKILSEAVSGRNKQSLHEIVDRLKARGMTKGRTAILISQSVVQKHYIAGGNNQIIMATDGKFRFEKEDFDLWKERQGKKTVVLSTVVFGTDKEAIRNLKEIARRTKGSFIQIRSRESSHNALLNEVRERSRI